MSWAISIFSKVFSVKGVRINVGQIVLIRISNEPHSIAILFTIPSIACFEEEYTVRSIPPTCPICDEICIIEPLILDAFMAFAAYTDRKYADLKFKFITASKFSGDVSNAGECRAIPAEFITISYGSSITFSNANKSV